MSPIGKFDDDDDDICTDKHTEVNPNIHRLGRETKKLDSSNVQFWKNEKNTYFWEIWAKRTIFYHF